MLQGFSFEILNPTVSHVSQVFYVYMMLSRLSIENVIFKNKSWHVKL